MRKYLFSLLFILPCTVVSTASADDRMTKVDSYKSGNYFDCGCQSCAEKKRLAEEARKKKELEDLLKGK